MDTLYHLVPVDAWAAAKPSGPYFPPTYAQDGFTHLTKDPALLLTVANHFYKGECGDWAVLCIDSSKLTSEVKFEPAAPVGTRPSHGLGGKDEETDVPLFPHLYGTIDYAAVTNELPVKRSADGSFLSIPDLGITSS